MFGKKFELFLIANVTDNGQGRAETRFDHLTKCYDKKKNRDVTLVNFGGRQRFPCENCSLTFFLVLDPVRCPAKIHCTAVFPMRNKIPRSICWGA